jgi:Predicted acyltransferases
MMSDKINIPKISRLKQLDALRAIAIFMVMGRHKFVSRIWEQVGWVGVEIFFIMSGFLIGNVLFTEYRQTENINFKRFLVSRGIRIYIPFYLFILLTVIHNLVFNLELSWKSVISELFFVQNYAKPLWNHTWYLAVDQHFYVILLPISLILMLKTSKNKSDPFRPVVKLYFLVAILMLILRTLTAVFLPYTHQTHAFPTHLRLDGLTLGVLMAYLYNFHYPKVVNFIKSYRKVILISSIILISPCLFFELEKSQFLQSLGITIIEFGFAGLIISLIVWETNFPPLIEQIFNPIIDILAVIGLSSYSIYLWHMAVIRWGVEGFHRLFPNTSIHFVVEFWLYFVVSICLGLLMAKLVENPTQQLRNWLYPPKS